MVSISGNKGVGVDMSQLLQVENLETKFRTADGKLPAVRNISFSVDKEETLCIVGESGSGKVLHRYLLWGFFRQTVKFPVVLFFGR